MQILVHNSGMSANFLILLHLDVPRMKDRTKKAHRQNTKKRQNLQQKRCVSRPNISFWMKVSETFIFPPHPCKQRNNEKKQKQGKQHKQQEEETTPEEEDKVDYTTVNGGR
jgi:hypothetical protein